MPIILNALYALFLLTALPFIVWRSWKTGRYRANLKAKLFGMKSAPMPAAPVWFHGVSVGEVHLLRTIVLEFRLRFPDVPIVVSATTDTGIAEARKSFPDLLVVAWPFDFSWAVNATLNSIRPRVVVLAESELWPNFLHSARRWKIPVIVVNGRMSPRSTRRIRRFGTLAKSLLFGRIAAFGMQTEEYAANLRSIDIPADCIEVTGNIKYDGASKDPNSAAVHALRGQFGFKSNETILIAGSTHAPEEEMILGIYRRLKGEFPTLRLIVVPRSPDRFEAVAKLIEEADFSLLRRTTMMAARPDAVILIDTLGELATVWGLADIAFVGGTFDGQRGGQSMIEPAGYGVPIVVGPHVWNFRDTVARLIECGGCAKVQSPHELEETLRGWLKDQVQRRMAGEAARKMIESQQGATDKTMKLLERYVSLPL